MADDLRFNTEAFETAIKEYEELIEDMTALKDALGKQMEELATGSWNSEAGKKFQEHYGETWKKNVETYTEFLSHLKETLTDVETKYQALYDRAETLNIL